ncbi:MAG: hypothetical protein ED559_01430 [Phycisphaera sp.]|nr:MAG: hypothetical protein ED559_01430 [Phycisphaera sp.]
MSDPALDNIERGLREMTEPRSTQEGERTELWKKALEISRADERSALIHPGRDAEFEPRPTRGRRLFLALNGVGVAAIMVLAAGVWTIAINAPSPSEQAELANEMEAAASRSDAMSEPATDKPEMIAESTESSAKLFESSALADAGAMEFDRGRRQLGIENDMIADLGDAEDETDDFRLRLSPDMARSRSASSGLEIDESVDDAAPVEIAARDEALTMPAEVEGEHPPGIMQAPRAFEEGRPLGRGNAGMFATPAIETASIVIEVDDIDYAYNTMNELPQAEFGEFSEIDFDDASAMTLNFSPYRMDEALDSIRGLGSVVEESRKPDNQLSRVNLAMSNTATAIEPIRETLEEYGLRPGMNEHERMHVLGRIKPEELVDMVERAVADIGRQIENAKRSTGLSRVRVSIKERTESDTIEE